MIADQYSLAVQHQQKGIDNKYQDQKKQDTEIYVWGTDKYGQLGLGHKHQGKNYTIPKICCYNLVIRTVSCGEEHSAFITQRGHIYTIGSNEDGKLGISTKSIPSSSTPCLVEDLSKLKCLNLSCGQSHTVAVMQNGEVYGWGHGQYGQLGNGSQESSYSPTRVLSENNEFIHSQCGARHTVLLDIKKRVYVCGSNENGQLGLKNSKLEVFIQKKEQRGIVEAACGQYHTLLLDEAGRVYASGANSFGQLGVGSKQNLYEFAQVQCLEGEQIIKVAAGSHSAALNRKGELFLWGTGVFGEYLLPHKINRHSKGTSFSDISVGNLFASAVDINGTVWTWGANSNGELGLGDYESRQTPSVLQALKGRHVQKISCGGGFAMALGNKIPKEKTPNPKDNLSRKLADNNNYISSQSQQVISLQNEELKQKQIEYNSLQKNYSTVTNDYKSTKPSLSQNHSMIVERTAPKLKENSHSPLQKSYHFDKKPTSSSTTTKKVNKTDLSTSQVHQRNNVLQESNNQFDLEKKRKQSVERLHSGYKENIISEKKQIQPSHSQDKRSVSQTKTKKKSSTLQTTASSNKMIRSELYQSQVNKENIQDDLPSSKRFAKKQTISTLQVENELIERFNNKITELEKKLSKETTEKKALKKELGILKENLDEIQFGQDGLSSINETMQSQYTKLYNLQNEYDELLLKYQEQEIILEQKSSEQLRYKEQSNILIKDLTRLKEETIIKDKQIYELKDEIQLLADDKRNNINFQNQSYENQIKKLQIELTDTKSQNVSYKNISEQYRSEIETLRRTIESFKQNGEQDKRSREELQRQNEQLKNEVEAYKQRLEDSYQEKDEYLTQLRKIKQEKENDCINGLQLEDTIRELNHEKNKILIERNQLENELMNLKERVQASERQEIIAEKKIQELSQIKQTYEYDKEQLKYELDQKIKEQNCLHDRVTGYIQKLQDMEEKNTQLTVLLNQEIDKQAYQFKQDIENSQIMHQSAEKRPISTTDLILNNQYSQSSKKSFGKTFNESIPIKSLAYSDQKQYQQKDSEQIRSAQKNRSKSIDTSFNISQKTGSQHKIKQNFQILNNSVNKSYHIKTQPFDSNFKNTNKSLDNINNLSSLSADQLPTFSEYDFSNTKPFSNIQNSAGKNQDHIVERFNFTPQQQYQQYNDDTSQKNHIFVQDSYEQKSEQRGNQQQYKVRSVSAQKLLNLIERNNDSANIQPKNQYNSKTPEKMVKFQGQGYDNSDNNNFDQIFNIEEKINRSNKKQQLEQIQEEQQQPKDTYEAKDLLELTNVRQRLAEMRKTKDMVFSRMMDFDQKIKKFTEQQEKVLNKK